MSKVPSGKKWTAQEAFDAVVEHLATQPARGGVMRGDVACGGEQYFACKYRGDNGTSCAIGCLIPDDEYTARLDTGMCADEVIESVPAFSVMLATGSRAKELLCDLQSAHDRDRNWSKEKGFVAWPALAAIAQTYGLNKSELLVDKLEGQKNA